MSHLLSKIKKSPSARNVGKLLSANVFAQVVGILVYPFLTRMYAPEDFGLVSFFLSIGGIFVLLASMDYFNAIVLPKTDLQARGVVHVSLLCIAVLTLLLVCSVPFAALIARLLHSPDLARFWWLIPIYVFLASCWNVLNYWYIRRQAYNRISGYQASQSLLSAGYKMGFGVIGWLRGGLLYSTVLAPLCSLLISVCLSARSHIRFLLKWDKESCKKAAVEYSNFPKYSTPRSLLNYVSGNLPTLMLAPIFGMTELGYVGMAFTLAFRPIQLIVQSVYQVFYRQIAEKVNQRLAIGRLLARYIGSATMVIVPVFIGLYIFLPGLTAWLLGASWRITGEYIRILLPWIMMVVLNTSINFIPDVFGKQRVLLGMEISYFVLRVLSLWIGIHAQSIRLALVLFSASGVIVLLVELVWFFVLAHRHDKQLEQCN